MIALNSIREKLNRDLKSLKLKKKQIKKQIER